MFRTVFDANEISIHFNPPKIDEMTSCSAKSPLRGLDLS